MLLKDLLENNITDDIFDQLFHGTSIFQFQKLKQNNWNAEEIYLADQETKSWEYAELQCQKDGSSDMILIVLETKSLNPAGIEIDRGSNEEEYQYNMGQYTYHGNIKNAILDILVNGKRTSDTEYQNLMNN